MADRAKKVIQRFPNRAVDIFHCFSPSQKESKEWLIKCLNDYVTDKKIYRYRNIRFLVWVSSYLLEKQFKNLITEIKCYDVDDLSKERR